MGQSPRGETGRDAPSSNSVDAAVPISLNCATYGRNGVRDWTFRLPENVSLNLSAELLKLKTWLEDKTEQNGNGFAQLESQNSAS